MTEPNAANGNVAGEMNGTPPETVDKTTAYRAPIEASELLRADAGDVKAEAVNMDRSGAETITAERVSMDRSGTRTLDAKSAHLENSGAVLLKAENAVFHGGAAVAVRAVNAKIVRSNFVALNVAEKTTIEGEVNALLYAGPADEKVKPVFTASGAAAFGAAFAAVLLVLGRVARRMIGGGE